MAKRANLAELRAQGLLPFQAEVVTEFLNSASEPIWEVASPPGTGKTRLAAAVVRHVLQGREGARALVLVPKAMGVMWTDELNSICPAAMWVDRGKLVELMASAGVGHHPFPAGTAIVMSIDLAKRVDVLTVLKSVAWDLAVADESHLLAGKRADAFFGLLKDGRARRGLLLTSVPSTGRFPFALSIARRTFSWNDIKDWKGRPVFVIQQPTVAFVMYERSAEEAALLRNLEPLAARIAEVFPALRFQAAVLVRAASSSLYAAERRTRELLGVLRHIRNLLEHGRALDLASLLGPLEDETYSDASDVDVLPATQLSPESQASVMELVASMERFLEGFEAVPRDAKLDRLRQLLDEAARELQTAYVCVWTGFVSTSQYLTAVLEGRGSPVFRLTASMGLDARAENVTRFRDVGGVLLTGGPAVEGLSLPFVDMCIHYDLPVDPRTLEQRLGAFLRYGRDKKLQSIVLRDVAGSLAWEDALFRNLGPALESPS